MKNILGLDLGSASIGWAYIRESEDDSTPSEIVSLGVRPVPLTSDEANQFTQGKAITTNATRRQARSARRNRQRYKQRRLHLIHTLRAHGVLKEDTPLTEIGKNSTYETLKLRARAAREEVTLEELGRVLLAINKKRGYRSSRKVNNPEDEGQIIDGMQVACELNSRGITPGQYVYELLLSGVRRVPNFYRSDLLDEFVRIWSTQQYFYPDLLTSTLFEELKGKSSNNTWAICHEAWGIQGMGRKGTRDEKKREDYCWRASAVSERIGLEELAIVLQAINGDVQKSSGYLGAISDRSKELYFKGWTVGEYMLHSINNNRHTPLKNQVFYRSDYADEFETIWNTQHQYHPDVLTAELKAKVKDNTIFYQRNLKSQKHLISFCEFEQREVVVYNPETKEPIGTKVVGRRVAPKSSPLFQEFKIRQVLSNLQLVPKGSNARVPKKITTEQGLFGEQEVSSLFSFEEIKSRLLSEEEKDVLFDEVNVKGNIKASEALKILGYDGKEWSFNGYTTIEGNRTNQVLYDAYLRVAEVLGYDRRTIIAAKVDKDDADLSITDATAPAVEVKRNLRNIFAEAGIDTRILDFDAMAVGKNFENQPSYMLWHLLYSYEEDDSVSGNEHLYQLLQSKFGFSEETAKVLGRVTFGQDYGSLSTKAMRKIYPHLRTMVYSGACKEAGYRHSEDSRTAEEIENTVLKDSLEILKRNSLRQPVVEKVLNQMINLINALMDKYSVRSADGSVMEPFHFDEIRIELARELKQSAAERARTSKDIADGMRRNEKVVKRLQTKFGIPSPSRNDIIRYRLYEELRNNGYKELYMNAYIPEEKLFSPEVDVDHIIPQALLFNDSYSNKILTLKSLNAAKSNTTAMDFVSSKHTEGLSDYLARVEALYKGRDISKAKYQNLLKSAKDIESGFINRDLRVTQYITRLALRMLKTVSKSVVVTTGKVTDKLREEWGLINIIRELNLPKYRANNETERITRKDGSTHEVIKDWTKRNDHRHHAMDALTVAFTTRSHVQFLNTLNAHGDDSRSLDEKISNALKDNGSKKKLFAEPMPNFRAESKKHLQSIIVSHKAKTKAVSKAKNHIRGQNVPQDILTPRGQLHKETVFGKRKRLMNVPTKLNNKFTFEQVNLIADEEIRTVVLDRIKRYGGDVSLALDSKTSRKDPILVNGEPITEVLCYEIIYTKREDVTDKLNLENVVDAGIRRILERRLRDCGGDAKKAFGDLTTNPIWLNETEGIAIKRVTIKAKVTNGIPLHSKRDHVGQAICDANGIEIPTDYVEPRNNHHAAIYIDHLGNVHEEIIRFMDAVDRANNNLPIINRKHPKHSDWKLLFTIKINEMFVFPNEEIGFDPTEIDLLDPKNKAIISPNLYRAQKLSSRDYFFRHHLESTIKIDVKGLTFYRIQDLKRLRGVVKVRINHLGDIVQVGEY